MESMVNINITRAQFEVKRITSSLYCTVETKYCMDNLTWTNVRWNVHLY